MFRSILGLPQSGLANKLGFIIVGSQKSGTSALNYYLMQHPDIALGMRKELHFFDNEKIFKRNNPSYKLLHKQILNIPSSKISGECTPIYMYWTPAMKRIWEYNPKIKIIAILRNPVKRAFSQWNMSRAHGQMPYSFEEYLDKESELARKFLPSQSMAYSSIDRGFYSEQLRRIFAFFKKENVLILKYEYFRENQLESLHTILKFLGLDANLLRFQEEQINMSSYESEIPGKAERLLLEIYKNEIQEVERMLGWDCDDWKKGAGK